MCKKEMIRTINRHPTPQNHSITIPTYLPTHLPTYTHTHLYTGTHVYTCIILHTYTYEHVHKPGFTFRCYFTKLHTPVTHTHIKTRTHTHAYAYTYTYTPVAFYTYFKQTVAYTLVQNFHCEFCCGAHLTCKNNSLNLTGVGH